MNFLIKPTHPQFFFNLATCSTVSYLLQVTLFIFSSFSSLHQFTLLQTWNKTLTTNWLSLSLWICSPLPLSENLISAEIDVETQYIETVRERKNCSLNNLVSYLIAQYLIRDQILHLRMACRDESGPSLFEVLVSSFIKCNMLSFIVVSLLRYFYLKDWDIIVDNHYLDCLIVSFPNIVQHIILKEKMAITIKGTRSLGSVELVFEKRL